MKGLYLIIGPLSSSFSHMVLSFSSRKVTLFLKLPLFQITKNPDNLNRFVLLVFFILHDIIKLALTITATEIYKIKLNQTKL